MQGRGKILPAAGRKIIIMEITKILHQDFENWLNTLGYAESTVYSSINYVKDFLAWLQAQKIYDLNHIRKQQIQNYYTHLQERKNKRRAGSISTNTIISNINALKRFCRYLEYTGKPTIEIDLSLQAEKANTKTILTQAEIKALYKACSNDYLGIRDRAILSVFYGCGLRRSEGAALDISDILFKRSLVFVRKGKNCRERYVPMTESIKEELENYIYVSREKILSFKNINQSIFLPTNQALFLNQQSKRLSGCGLQNRIHKLIEKSRIQKKAGLHTLRHSIATHLLQSGMELEEIRRFLGHATLESTQIYTHLSAEME